MDDREQTFANWERRERFALAVIPYFSIALATAVVFTVDHESLGTVLTRAGLTVATVSWVAWMVTLRPGRLDSRPVVAAVYFVVLLFLLGGLIGTHPLYGFTVMTGYLHAFLLPSRWRIPGIVATAALAAAAQVGGFANLSDVGGLIYLLVLSVNAGLAGTFSVMTYRAGEAAAVRKEMINELAGANARLEEAMAENAGLHARLLAQAREAGVHDERQRMAGEIHDTIAQGLAGIVTQLQAAEHAHDRGAGWRRHVDVAQEMARESLAEARRSVQALRPQPLEEDGLPEALAGVVARWTARHGVPVEVSTTGAVQSMHPEVEGTLLRTAQEALANVAKHAGASRVALTLSYMGDLVTLDVRDDGAGFAPDRVKVTDGGYGLTAMRRRVARVAGTLEIESEPGSGTAVSAIVPAIPMGGAA